MHITILSGPPGSGKTVALEVLSEAWDIPIINSKSLMQAMPALMTKVSALNRVTLVDEVVPKDLEKLRVLAAQYPAGYYIYAVMLAP